MRSLCVLLNVHSLFRSLARFPSIPLSSTFSSVRFSFHSCDPFPMHSPLRLAMRSNPPPCVLLCVSLRFSEIFSTFSVPFPLRSPCIIPSFSHASTPLYFAMRFLVRYNEFLHAFPVPFPLVFRMHSLFRFLLCSACILRTCNNNNNNNNF